MGLGSRIEKIRGTLSRQEFGAQIGVGKTTIQNYETKDLVPKGHVLLRIRDRFKVNIEWLLTGLGEPYIKDTEMLLCEPSTAYEGVSSPALGQAVDMLATVLGSGDQVFIQALMSNLIAFSSAVRESRRQAARIAALEERLAKLEEKVRDKQEEKCLASGAM